MAVIEVAQSVAKRSVVNGSMHPEFIRETTLPEIFANTCRKYAGKTALIFENNSLTYQQLDQRSTEVAAWLCNKGLGTGSVIGVWLNRGIDLHICILGILKCGAAYIPFDSEMPEDRVFAVLQETGAKGCFLESVPKDNATGISSFIPGDIFSQASILPNGPLNQHPQPDDVAYIIFTSGSTGKPKGIPIAHRQIAHLLLSENSVLQINHTDISYQGFSVSFDMWLEETWIAYLAGATLVISDAITAKSFDTLHQFLNKYSVTVLHAVPSLLAMISTKIPSLRLINSGGEACTKSVQNKWTALDLLFFNSYGPTETTVTASCSQLGINDEITIGYPLPNYSMAVVDENMQPVHIGEKGELVISGPGVAGGYLNREDLTAQKFLPKPESLSGMFGEKIYLSGDIAYINEAGKVCISGRTDDQVKLRGYRIELGEIESALIKTGDVNQAVVLVKKVNGIDSLIAFVMDNVNSTSPFDEKLLKKKLALELPGYMVPAQIISLQSFPYLASGKVNKKLLPFTETFAKEKEETSIIENDENATVEEKGLRLLEKLFPEETVRSDKDFFDDLGGYSLLAACFVSEMREKAGIEEVSVRDVYTRRPLQELFTYWQSLKKEENPAAAKPHYKAGNFSYYMCWVAQSVALIFIYAILAAQIFVPYLGYYYLEQKTDTHVVPILFALILFCVVPIIITTLSISLKWLIIGKMKEGDYPLWGVYYFRWWLARKLIGLVQMQVISGTPLFNSFLNLLGARVAKDAQLSHFAIGAEDLITIGANVTISSNVVLNNAYVEGGYLKLRKITIMDNAYVGTAAIVNGGCTLQAGAELSDQSALGKDITMQGNEVWTGSPAAHVSTKKAEETAYTNTISNGRQLKYKIVFFLLIFIFPFAILLPLVPTIVFINTMDDNTKADYDFSYLAFTPLLSFVYIVVFITLIVVASRWLQRKVRAGSFSLYSPFYVKKWLADQLMSLSLTVLHPIFASIYVSWFFRLLGAKVGKNTEISTASNVTHKLFTIGDESFVADAVVLGETDIRNQEIILAETTIGNRTFIGNSALVPQGSQLGDDMLIGVLSVPPTVDQQTETHVKDWLGSPAMALPRRQPGAAFSPKLTFNPSLARRVARGVVEFIRIVLPQTAILCLCILFIAYGDDLLRNNSIGKIIFLFPFYYLGIVAMPAYLITLVLKWGVAGKYKEQQLPMWTWKVWRSEGITTLYEALAVPFLLEQMKGSPWLPFLLRLLGVKVGKKVWMNSSDITEFDMVKIGDYSEINFDSGPQTHLFEDRIMKIGKVSIGEECTIGAKSIILYDTHVGNNTIVEPLSLVMKGETLPCNSRWAGAPVEKA